MLTLLVPRFPIDNANLAALLPALDRAGVAWQLRAAEGLRLAGRDVAAPDERGNFAPLLPTDHHWLFGFGVRTNLLDRLQLLDLAVPAARYVTPPRELLHAHAKYALVDCPLPLRHPETHASHDADWLWRIVAEGGEWIAKPPAASFGRGVFRLHRDDRNARALLDELTGHGTGQYALLQRYVPAIDNGEKRVLLAFGEVIGAYLRRPSASGITNLAAGGSAEACELQSAEAAAMCDYANQLAARGIHYAGIDLAYPWLIEVNVANPGGLATLVALGDTAAADRLAAAAARWMTNDAK